jgi:ATP-binding cassette subfamily C protein
MAIFGVLVLGFAQASSARPAHHLGQLFGEKNRHVQAVVTDSMDSLRLVRAHDAARVWTAKLSQAFDDAREVQVANARRAGTVSAASSVGLAAAAGILVLVSVHAGVSPPLIIVILLVVARLASQVQAVANYLIAVANLLPAVGDLSGLTSRARQAAEVPSGENHSSDFRFDAHPDDPLLQFQDVSYCYPESPNGLDRVSFSVPRGRITALTGPSGSGKSTAVDVALGLLRPTSGQVLVAGASVRVDDLPNWRRHVAYVPQDAFLIPGTVRENLVWSVPGHVTDEQCWHALDRSAARFARLLPEGLDTLLGDRGIRLSGGEKQRIGIARALLRDPKLLVLDEATSALDDATEAEILALINSLTPEVTILVVAHRRSTIEGADHVVRLLSGAAADPLRQVP